MKIEFIGFLTLILLVCSSSVSADIVPLGYKYVSYCFEISNIDDFPDYTFIASPVFVNSEYKVIKKNECVGFYKLCSPRVYAIKNSNFYRLQQDMQMRRTRSNMSEYEKYMKSFLQSSNATPSNIKIYSQDQVFFLSPLDKIVEVFRIKNLTDSKLELIKSKVIYTYTDGNTEEKAYISQNIRPRPSRQSILPLVLTIIIEFIILFIFIKKNPFRLLLYSLLINSITLPVATYFYLAFRSYLGIIEILVFLTESLLLKWFLKVEYKRALLISFVANLTTFLLGLIFF